MWLSIAAQSTYLDLARRRPLVDESAPASGASGSDPFAVSINIPPAKEFGTAKDK